MDQKELLEILENLAVMLEIKGESPFKSRAYQNAADIIKVQQLDIEKLVNQNKLAEIKGFGKALVEKITDYVENGKMTYYERLKEEIPLSLIKMTKLDGIGNKKAGQIYQELGISEIDELEKAAKENKIQELKGFSKNTQEKIIESIQVYKEMEAEMKGKSFKNIM
jgi:DNA polymerase (family 10)